MELITICIYFVHVCLHYYNEQQILSVQQITYILPLPFISVM